MDRTKLDMLYLKTLAYFGDAPGSIQHFAKVHSFAALIGRQEGLTDKEQFTLEAAAFVHDVGIPPAIKKYGSGSGKYQELEGAPVAAEMLSSLAFPPEVTERVAYLVGHHHTYTDIDGADYQVLVEADFLVNFYEGNTPAENIVSTGRNIFKTKTGIKMLSEMFGVSV